MKNRLIIIIILIIWMQTAFSKEPVFDIKLNNSLLYSKVLLENVHNDSLSFKAYGNTSSVHIDSIRYIKLERKSYAWTGMTIGLLFGSLIGYNQIKKQDYGITKIGYGGAGGLILYAAGGGILGSIFGKELSKDREFHLNDKTQAEKRKIIRKLISLK